jgi:hypothetical protein
MTRIMGNDPGYSYGVAVTDDGALLFAEVIRCPPPRNLDDHEAVSTALAKLACRLVDIYRQFDDGNGLHVATEGHNIPKTWQDLNIKSRRNGRRLDKVSLGGGLWPRQQYSMLCGLFHPVHTVRPRTHEGIRYPHELTESGWPAKWSNGDPKGSTRDAQSAFRVATKVAAKFRVRVPA